MTAPCSAPFEVTRLEMTDRGASVDDARSSTNQVARIRLSTTGTMVYASCYTLSDRLR